MQVSSYLFQSPYSQPVQVGRPDPVQVQKQAAEESAKSKDKDNAVDQQNTQSKIEPMGINVKSSTPYQNDISSRSTSEAVNTLIAVSKDAQRSENIKAYVNN